MTYEFSNKISGMKPSIIREILKQMSDPSLISFAGGNPDAHSFPFDDISRLSQELLANDPVGMLQYSLTEGVPSVRSAIAKFACRKYNVMSDNDELIITSGSVNPSSTNSTRFGDMAITAASKKFGDLEPFGFLSITILPAPL
ncbi:MAG: PLP-dependent aminotransferase family protein, partial [Oscillospiraceae bacterium]